jgi:hypothetical protein
MAGDGESPTGISTLATIAGAISLTFDLMFLNAATVSICGFSDVNSPRRAWSRLLWFHHFRGSANMSGRPVGADRLPPPSPPPPPPPPPVIVWVLVIPSDAGVWSSFTTHPLYMNTVLFGSRRNLRHTLARTVPIGARR